MVTEAPSAEVYLQALIDQSTSFAIGLDQNLILKSFNQSSFKLFQQLGIEIKLGDSFLDYLTIFPTKLQHLQRALNEQKFSVCESWGTDPYQTEYAPLYNSRKDKIGVCVIGRAMNEWDVETDETKPEKEESFWPHVVVFGRGRDSQSILQQPSWESFTGQTQEQYDGYGWLEAHHPDYRTKVHHIWKDVCASKNPRAFSFMSLIWNAKLATYRHILIHATPQLDSLRELSYWNCAGIDFHELLQSQEQLRLATQRLKLILEAGQTGIWDWDFETGEVRANKTYSKTFGREFVSEILPVNELFDQIIDREMVEAAIKDTVENGKPYEVECFRVRWPDGSIHFMGTRGEFHVTKDGRKSLLGVNWDVTARKQMEEERVRFLKHEEEIRSSKQAEEFERKRAEEAEEHQRRQEEFIDTVCHEIRNPLVGIYGGVHLATEEVCSLLKQNDFENRVIQVLERIKLHLGSMLKCAEQQKILVDDVLDMSKLQNNMIELVSVPFQLSSCLQLVLDMFRSRIEEKKLKLEAKLPSPEIFVKADINRFQQIIINLLSNAVKFTDEGTITILTEVQQVNEEMTVEIEIRDTGIGIDKDAISLIFDRFTQVRNTKRTQYGGTGLGLAISKRLVETMGGRITVDSTPGRGSSFRFYIKAGVVTSVEREIAIEEEPMDGNGVEGNTSGLQILVVDDNSLNQKILACYLEKAGHSVQVASDGYEAVQKAAQRRFDIIFMDIEMPNMNGLQATVALRQREQEQLTFRSAIIGLSGNARREKIDAALGSGMDMYLTKPYHRDEILQAIAKVQQAGNNKTRVRKASSDDLRLTKHPRS